MMRMSGPEPGVLFAGLVPQEADLRWDFVGFKGVSIAGVESLVGGDVSTSRQDTDGDLICCDENNRRCADGGWDCFPNKQLCFTFVSLESRLLTGEGKSKRLSLSPARLLRDVLKLPTYDNTHSGAHRTWFSFHASFLTLGTV